MKEKATYGVKFKDIPVGTVFVYGGEQWLKIINEGTGDKWIINMKTCSIPLEDEIKADTIVYPYAGSFN